MKKILMITGSDRGKNNDIIKQTEIEDDVLEFIRPVLKAIADNKKSHNWAIGTHLDKNHQTGDWDLIPNWWKMYCQFSDEQLEVLGKYMPSYIDRITSIKILTMDIVATENIL